MFRQFLEKGITSLLKIAVPRADALSNILAITGSIED
jgi:hypothetical protein